jgi:hypothetical protein
VGSPVGHNLCAHGGVLLEFVAVFSRLLQSDECDLPIFREGDHGFANDIHHHVW